MMTWIDIEVGDKFNKFGVEGLVIEKIKAITGDYIKSIKIESANKEIVVVSIGGDNTC
jgi:hypothetical protein